MREGKAGCRGWGRMQPVALLDEDSNAYLIQ